MEDLRADYEELLEPFDEDGAGFVRYLLYLALRRKDLDQFARDMEKMDEPLPKSVLFAEVRDAAARFLKRIADLEEEGLFYDSISYTKEELSKRPGYCVSRLPSLKTALVVMKALEQDAAQKLAGHKNTTRKGGCSKHFRCKPLVGSLITYREYVVQMRMNDGYGRKMQEHLGWRLFAKWINWLDLIQPLKREFTSPGQFGLQDINAETISLKSHAKMVISPGTARSWWNQQKSIHPCDSIIPYLKWCRCLHDQTSEGYEYRHKDRLKDYELDYIDRVLGYAKCTADQLRQHLFMASSSCLPSPLPIEKMSKEELLHDDYLPD